jgi:hypothetical protein
MRVVLTFVLVLLGAAPARAWEFSPVPVCTLTHDEAGHAVTVTWDPRQAEPYAIRIEGQASWPAAPVFAIDYAGPRPLMISTARHRLSADGRAVTVTDTGFGNVLDGLEFNATATAVMGGAQVAFSLAGAAEPVRAFRACTEAPLAGMPGAGMTAG